MIPVRLESLTYELRDSSGWLAGLRVADAVGDDEPRLSGCGGRAVLVDRAARAVFAVVHHLLRPRALVSPRHLGDRYDGLGVSHRRRDFDNVRIDVFSKSLGLFFGTLFAICMVCHGELVRLRPAPRHLTEFYLMIAAGGAIGGIFVSLIAPHIFKTFLEWNFGLVASYGVAFVVWMVATRRGFGKVRQRSGSAVRELAVGELALAAVLLVGLLFVAGWQWDKASPGENTQYRAPKFLRTRERSPANQRRGFFPLHETAQRPYVPRHAVHQRRHHAAPRLTTFYGENTGVGHAIRFFQSRPNLHVGVVGLGAGTLAAYAKMPGQRVTFYEINPEVEKIARTYFTFLKDSPAMPRSCWATRGFRSTAQEPQKFDVLVLDAFSGDAPPAHLLTREAFAIYQRHMSEGGIIAVHITNRYVDLRRSFRPRPTTIISARRGSRPTTMTTTN